MIVAKFHDRHIRPPQGGWSYPIAGVLVTKYSEGDILEAIEKWHRNNNTGKRREEIEADLWAYYCQRQPDRCGVSASSVTIDVPGIAAPPVVAEKTPEMQGPPIWRFLNTLAAQWTPALHDYFLATCDAIISILECPICRGEWRILLQQEPPLTLSSRLAVCQWVNRQHNAVNRRKGKVEYPYARMVAEYGAPVP